MARIVAIKDESFTTQLVCGGFSSELVWLTVRFGFFVALNVKPRLELGNVGVDFGIIVRRSIHQCKLSTGIRHFLMAESCVNGFCKATNLL